MRVGVLGLGSIGLRHARNIISLQHEVFGFDPDEGRQALLATYGGVPVPRQSVLACDRVVIATPTQYHQKDLEEVRCPTLCEKPLADKPIDFDLSHVSMVGYNLRFHACVIQTKQWIKDHIIGATMHGHFVLAQFNDKPAYLRDGVTLNWSHEIDLCLYLLGPGELLSITNKNNTISDLFIQHTNGTVSSIHLNYINKKEERYFDILGTKGKIHCVLSPYRTADCEAENGAIYKYSYHSTFDEDYVTELDSFLSGEIGPGCTAQEAKEVLKICLWGAK